MATRPAIAAVVLGVAATVGAEPSTRSVSCGSANRGGLGNPVELPRRGPGYVIPPLWWKRGYRYGTAELVGLIRRAARRVARKSGGAVLGVADLSRARGGAIPHHRSHQSGRDADLLYYATDERGRPLPPRSFMPRYRRDGRATHANSPRWMKLPRERHFDRRRNWLLVVSLVTDPDAPADRIWVSLPVYRWLMAEAERSNASPELVGAVTDVLRVARGRNDHGDHMHVRIKCTREDIRVGLCRPYLAPSRGGKLKYREGIRCPR